MSQVIETKATALRTAWEQLKKEKPALRIRDCATYLGVSEGELLATTVGDYTMALEGDWTVLLSRLPELGRVMSLTRNDACVLENKGTFQKVDIMGSPAHRMATVIGPIETRVFFSAWKFGFAVRQTTPNGLQQSIQIFDEAGTAITKIFLQADRGNQEAFDRLIADFTSAEQKQEIATTVVREVPTKHIDELNREALLADWAAMKDTHDFFGMLRKHGANRLDAVRVASGKFSYQVNQSSLRTILEKASADKLPIMIFTGNRGNIQIHQGKVTTIRASDAWLNVLDPDFNMHLREDLVDSVWVVKKPTEDGVVTGIEVFDKNREMVVQFFGLRKPGIPELESWRALVESLQRA